MLKSLSVLAVFLLLINPIVIAQVNVGSGSYTTTFPGVDAAGRNGFPSGTPFVTGQAANKAVPTNDWWSHKVKNPHSDNLFNYPFTMKTKNEGLLISYVPWGPIDAFEPLIVGVTGLNANESRVSDFSDWTVSMDWQNGSHQFTAMSGIGLPFIYFTKGSSDVASITINQGTVVVSNEMIVITDVHNGADFAIYAPLGSSWTQTGNTYTSTLNGKNYWSLGFIPGNASSVMNGANLYKKYAYVFPSNTEVNWSYNENTRVVSTDFTVIPEVMEGTDSTMLQGLLPHHWANLANSPALEAHVYPTVRGELKTIESNVFTVENTFHGILPTLPYLNYYNANFNPAEMNSKIKLLENDALNPWTDSYNEGQEMNRLVQTARIAEFTGDTVALNKLLNTVKTRLEDWLSVQANEVAFIFYYNQTWTALLGYPAGHGQDVNINDHHFHWGYFIHAAAFIEQFEPGWASQWGGMIDLLVRDAASPNRNDNLFPFLRNFSPYAGHCWANGFASFPQGNDQESTSESMQFNSSLIHWGSITDNDSIRDLGIYLYTTEQSAVEEYWFDKYERNFGPNQNYSLVSRVWGNSYDNGTFWTADIAASYGIELYPIHGGSMYLGHDTAYVNKLWAEMEQNTGILTNDPNVNLWHDTYWKYLSFIDPDKALTLYNSFPNRDLKFGISDAQTYHWLYAMSVLGNVELSINADHPLAVVFNNNGDTTYVAQNYSSNPISVNYSSGYVLNVPANSIATSKDVNINGVLSSSFTEAYAGGSVDLTVSVSGGNASSIAFYDGDSLLSTMNQGPYTFTAGNLGIGNHDFYARVYDGANFNITNLVTVRVGEQLPYSGNPFAIPGTFDAAHYDIYEGGSGNGISYLDLSRGNNGDFRTNEDVDASSDANEGDMVGWTASGEWLEYTIDVQQAGNYNLDFRYACGNNAGGGPISIYSDGELVKSGISISYSGGWSNWTTRAVNDVPLKLGEQVLRVFFENGEVNIGRLTWTNSSALNYSQPVADAGSNQVVVLPQSNATLNGSASYDPNSGTLNYNWEQIYGPSVLQFSNNTVAQPNISTLVAGVYKLKLTVDNGTYSDHDFVYVISSTNANAAPKVSFFSPENNSSFFAGEDVPLSIFASDLNDSVISVDIYANNSLVGTLNQSPYNYTWQPNSGNYVLHAVAKDAFGDSTISAPLNVLINPAPPCKDSSWNGDFQYEFSPDNDDPTLTFIPSVQGMGMPTCILYYGTNPSNMPGYNVTPNVPYQISASKGTRIYFYYTYSVPGAGEQNNSANKDTYIVGTCQNVGIEDFEEGKINYYPNPVTNTLVLDIGNKNARIKVSTLDGRLVDQFNVEGGLFNYDMSEFENGLYIFKIQSQKSLISIKVIKE